MGVTSDIAATYRGPRAVIRRHLARGLSEGRLAAFLFLACGLVFVAQWPRLRRAAFEDATVPFDALIGGALIGWLFVAPLALYALAGMAHLLARALGGQGTWATARLSLFWALLAASPLWLLTGLVAGFIGPGPQLALTGLAALSAFLVFWGAGMIETERGGVPA